VDRTGVHERRYGADGETTSDMALAAAEAAIGADPGVRDALAAIVVATSTPDQPQPATAAVLQHKLGLDTVPSFDLNAVCSGFVYAVTVVDAMLSTAMAGRSALVVGADKYSTIVNPADRRTATIFGDGAGAVVLGPVPDGYGVLGSRLVTDGRYRALIEVVAGGTRRPLDEAARADGDHFFRMNGLVVREYVLRVLPQIIDPVLSEHAMTLDDVDRVVIHQANTRLVEACATELGIGMDRIPLTAPLLGNTGVASIPITLGAAHAERPFRRGERVLLLSVGGGMSAGGVLLVWY
jgi:3-oxoacyl-[acyl-carrier-protein] synthase-3